MSQLIDDSKRFDLLHNLKEEKNCGKFSGHREKRTKAKIYSQGQVQKGRNIYVY